MTAYYNEIEPYAVQWLRNLIDAGLISPGIVDNRSIEDVTPNDLAGFKQCHFFAGIGGWSYALRLAGWPDDKPVWTGSCPCQPFSAAGKRGGFADERHLWPTWFWLIEQCRPSVIFGEQVASSTSEPWLDLVSTDLEAKGYAIAAADIPACSVGAPHIRSRRWFVADAGYQQAGRAAIAGQAQSGRAFGDATGYGELGDANIANKDRRASVGKQQVYGKNAEFAAGSTWEPADWIACKDGKSRPVKPGTFPLAHGIPRRMDKLRAYGNAIVPQVAAEFIKAACHQPATVAP